MAAKESSPVMTGTVVFAGCLMLVIGLINIFEGFIALFSDERLVLTRNHLVVVDTTGWGWVLLISGLLLMGVGAGLLVAQTWARITAIILVGLHAVIQVAWLGAYPVWALLMIALDVFILYALTMRWSGVREQLGDTGEAPWDGQQTADVTPPQRTTPPLQR
ncbi:hypothetical protein [Kribbella sp. NPDC004875]|uniref:DUF7144 family membrane protein n=1 Tax=Kribbella sp. NPDC004875 TaxID=3364107 RepID=UPI0036CA6EBE